MTLGTFAFALAAVAASTVAQAMLKHGVDRAGGVNLFGGQLISSIQKIVMEPFIIGALALILVAIPMWLQVLFRLPLSVAYPLVSMGYLFALVIGVVFFREALTPLRVAGVSIIMVGVFTLSRSA
jgi:multidrug transporter EmrE-like cation transporter